MAETIKIDIDVNEKRAVDAVNRVGQSAKDAGSNLNGIFGSGALGGVSAFAARISVVTFAISESVKAVKALAAIPLELGIAAEKIETINATFDLLAERAGIAGDALRKGLVEASQGLVDDEAILLAANKALLDTAVAAERLPELFTIARKASLVFGVDAVDAFESINTAISTGQTRQLRSINLFIDAQEAADKYARSLGITSNELTQTGRQQAILNEVLARGEKAFQGVDESANKITKGSKTLSTSFGELGDQSVLAFKKIYGPEINLANSALNFLVGGAKDAVQSFNEIGTAAQAAKKIPALTSEIESLNATLANLYERRKEIGILDVSGLLRSTSQINSIRNRIEEATKSLEEFKKVAAKDISSPEFVGPIKPPEAPESTTKTGAIDFAALAKKQITAESQLISLNQARLSSEREKLRFIEDSASRQAETTAVLSQQIDLIERESTNKTAQLLNQQKENRTFSATQLKEALLQIELDKKARIEAINQEILQNQISTSMTAMQGFSSVMSGFKSAAEDFAMSATKNFKQAGSALFQFAGQSAANAFAAFGRAIAKGENAIGAFLNSLLASLGQAAVNMGSQFILQGIAYTYAGMPNGPPLVAAGAALAAFGGLLSGLGGGGENVGVGGAGFGATPAPATEVEPEDLEQDRRSRVTVNIQGDVLDTRDTGLRIVELIQEAFDTSGAVASVGRA
jgi:hypothetical protein